MNDPPTGVLKNMLCLTRFSANFHCISGYCFLFFCCSNLNAKHGRQSESSSNELILKLKMTLFFELGKREIY